LKRPNNSAEKVSRDTALSYSRVNGNKLPLIAINLARKYGFYQILVVILDVIEKNRAKSQNFREKIWIIGNKCLSLHHEMAQPSMGRGEMLNRWNRLLASCTAGLERTFSKRCQSVVFKLRNFDSRNSGDAIEASSWVVFYVPMSDSHC